MVQLTSSITGANSASLIKADPAFKLRHGALDQMYALQQEIGQGAHGSAILATRIEDGEQVVIKQIRLSDMDDKARDEALKEVRLLSTFDHVNIVHYYESVLEDDCLNIVMEYASCGDLSEVIQKRATDKKPFSEDEIMFWFVQILLGLFHVHSQNILHRDLKSQNIFIAEGNILKLGDFGISRVLNSDTELANTVIGTPYYLSPEICEDRPYNRKSDVWALGCVLYELCTLKRAFDGQSLPALVVRILRGKYPPVPTRYTTPVRDLVDRMLKQNPKDRPNVDAILRQRYIQGHVERYAQHVMALSPLQPPPALGVALRSEEAAAGKERSRATPSKPSVASASPAKAVAARASPAPGGRRAAELPEPLAVHGAAGSGAAPGSGSGLGAVAAPAGRQPISSTWVNRQNAALQELEGALQAQGQGQDRRSSAPAGSAASPAGAGAGAGPAPASAAECGVDGSDGLAATVPSACLGGRVKVLTLKQQQKDAELEANRQAVNKVREERERKRQNAAKRSQEEAAAVRARVTERQRDVDRHLEEQRAEEERRQKKSVEAMQQLKAVKEAKLKLREDISNHMAAHREQVKQARARVSRDELARMGAQFAARMQPALIPSAAGVQLVVVDGISPPLDSSQEQTSSQRGSSPSAGGSTGPSRAGFRGAHAKSSASVGAVDGQGAAGAKQSADAPPWRARRSKSDAPFPAVEIFTPYGSELQQGKGKAVEGQDQGTGGAAEPGRRPGSQEKARALWAQRGKMELLSVLSQIQEVLAEAPDDEPEAGESLSAAATAPAVSPAKPFASAQAGAGAGPRGALPAAAGRPRSGSEPALGSGAKGSPANAAPTNGRPPAAAPKGTLASSATGTDKGGPKAAGGGGGGRLCLPPEKEEEGLQGTGSSAASSSAAAINAQKVEALRMRLEEQLTSKVFMEAYRFLRDVQRAGEQETDDGDAMQRQLEKILGRKLHLVRQIHKLITLEDSVFD